MKLGKKEEMTPKQVDAGNLAIGKIVLRNKNIFANKEIKQMFKELNIKTL